MAGQSTWGNAGDTNNSYIVNPKRAKEIYVSATWNTLVTKLTNGLTMQRQQLAHAKGLNVSIGNSSIIWETQITSGNEERLTMIEKREGLAGSYGDADVEPGNYDKFKHATVWINQIDSTVDPLPGRNALKQVKDIINDPKSLLMNGKKLWAAQEIDLEFIRACLMGASMNLLTTTKGGLGIALAKGTAGVFRSCYNLYVPETGLVTPSATRATHEASVAAGLATLQDSAQYAFDYGEHRKMGDLWSTLYGESATIGGKSYTCVAFMDPWLIHRLAISAGVYDTLMRDAAARGMSNPAIDHLAPIVLDGVLYIPYEPLKAFRPSVSGGLPVWGAGMTYDPRTYITSNTSMLCIGMFMGPGAILRATDKSMWYTAEKMAKHKDNYEYGLHWDDGFVRNEYSAYDGRTAMENKKMIVGVWYDPGVEVPFGS